MSKSITTCEHLFEIHEGKGRCKFCHTEPSHLQSPQTTNLRTQLKLSDDFYLIVDHLPLRRVKISLEKFNDPREWAMALEPSEAKWLKENL